MDQSERKWTCRNDRSPLIKHDDDDDNDDDNIDVRVWYYITTPTS